MAQTEIDLSKSSLVQELCWLDFSEIIHGYRDMFQYALKSHRYGLGRWLRPGRMLFWFTSSLYQRGARSILRWVMLVALSW
ncbi:hypothetical protein NHJ6243_009771 [Beauveria neobassiana]